MSGKLRNSIKNGKLSCNWLIMLVTMATPISSQVKDKNSIFATRDEDMIFLEKEKSWYFISIYTIIQFTTTVITIYDGCYNSVQDRTIPSDSNKECC